VSCPKQGSVLMNSDIKKIIATLQEYDDLGGVIKRLLK